MGGNYLDFDIRREALGRYGLTVADVRTSSRVPSGA